MRSMNDPLAFLNDTAKHWLDILSVGALAATLLDWVPALSAILVAAWTALRIYEVLLSIKLKRRELGE